MNEEVKTKEEVVVIQIEATKINLQSGDILFVTIKSDDLDSMEAETIKRGIGALFPNNKVILFGVGSDNDIKFTIANRSEVVYPIKEQGEEE